MEEKLGKIKKVSVKDIWEHEQYVFTPWLAEEENIAELGKAIGLELEVENVEVAVGPYSADILAKDVGSGKYVVIENQYGKTDHDHLGKLITYGSFLDASAIIWIAENFTLEHQRALNWLNDHTSDELSFYAVSLELWQIDKSLPAVRFNVISQPNEIMKQAAVIKSAGELTEAKKLQLEFWSEFRSRLIASKVVSSAQTPRPQYWFDVPLGKTHIVLSNIANTYEGRIGVRVYIGNKASSALDELLIAKDEIESEIGESLEWNPNPDNKDKIIALFRDVNLDERDNWPEYCDWLVSRVDKFRNAFGPRVKKMKFNQSETHTI
jgi:hypothetical protein